MHEKITLQEFMDGAKLFSVEEQITKIVFNEIQFFELFQYLLIKGFPFYSDGTSFKKAVMEYKDPRFAKELLKRKLVTSAEYNITRVLVRLENCVNINDWFDKCELTRMKNIPDII